MANKKPMLQYVIMCDDVAIYQDSNKVAILGVFEQIYVEKFPAVHPKLWLLSRFADGVGSYDAQSKILNPDGKVIFESEKVNFKLKDNVVSYNINGQLVGLPLDVEGKYWVETYLDDKLLNRIPFQVLTAPKKELEHNETTYH